MKNKVLKQMLAFSLAVALVGGNSVATFAAEPTNGTESGANTQAATDATGVNKVEKKKQLISHLTLIRKRVNLQIQRTLSM